MRVALMEGSLPYECLDQICSRVTEIFHMENTPLGLMLRLRPKDEHPPWQAYQYILLEGFTSSEAADYIEKHRLATGAIWMAKVEDTFDGWNGIVQGVMTNNLKIAEDARERQLIVVTSNRNIPSDAFLWPEDVQSVDLIQSKEFMNWDLNCAFNSYKKGLLQDMNTITGHILAMYAVQCEAKAIILFTIDGKNLAAVSSLYLPIPIIAVAKRPEGESMLLGQTIRWGILPTAISKTEQEPLHTEKFARFIATLYGYKPGDRMIAAGHWISGENQHHIDCFNL
jgi:hypothetical protein